MMPHKGEVKSITESNPNFEIRFKVPETDKEKSVILNPDDLRCLMSYLDLRLPQDMTGEKIPLLKDVYGRWFIDVPSNPYKRGNKIKYKIKRLFMENNWYVWKTGYKSNHKPASNMPEKTVSGTLSYKLSRKFNMMAYIASTLTIIMSVIFVHQSLMMNNHIIGGSIFTTSIILFCVSSFILVALTPVMGRYISESIFPQQTKG